MCDSNTLVYVCVEAVTAHSEKIAAEELQCKAMADNAQRDLHEALPALEEAMKVDLCFYICHFVLNECVYFVFILFVCSL